MKVYTIGSDEHLALIGRRIVVVGVAIVAYAVIKGTLNLKKNSTGAA